MMKYDLLNDIFLGEISEFLKKTTMTFTCMQHHDNMEDI